MNHLKAYDLVLDKKTELSSTSRTSALWLNYTQYVEIVHKFVRAERTNDWPLYISTTKFMLNLFAAYNNYAKTCCIYLQSVIALEKEHSRFFEQFILGNHTVSAH